MITQTINARGNAVAHQFVISDEEGETFHSYSSIIAKRDHKGKVTLDPVFWDYSATTLRHLKTFLGIAGSVNVIRKRITSGEYKTRNLN